MCGICGQASLDTENGLLDRAVLKRMNSRLVHRGPDGEGYYQGPGVMLGMRRLSIIDLETGEQPISNECGTIWVVFNGEIYNFRQVRQELEKRGHVFKTRSDTEVIVHAYEEYGQACVDHFTGMFSFALWDENRRRLLLVRDRLGIKPLFFWSGNGLFAFASELKALLCHPAVPREIDWASLDLFLSLEYIPGPRTIYKDIRKLPPGHMLVLEGGSFSMRQYWEVPAAPLPESTGKYEEVLYYLLQDAVNLRLVSDVPLGAFLSGGIDSSTIVALMSGSSSEPVRTFSIGFEDDTYNELAYAREVARKFNTRHTEQVLSQGIDSSAEALVRQFDEPFGDFSIFPTYLVSRLARNSVKVVLTGDGGDEIFGGYETYFAQDLDSIYRRLPAVFRQSILPGWMQRVPPRPEKKGLVNKAKRFVEGGALPASLNHVRWMIFTSAMDKAALYSPRLRELLVRDELDSIFEEHLKRAAGFAGVGQQQYVDLKTYLVDDILTKVDRMSMAASLEARLPLLDHRIVEFALNLPPAMKRRRGESKIILRRAMKGLLPEAVLSKPKQGFSIPMKHWLRTSLKPMMTDFLSTDSVRRRGYFNDQTVQRWVTEHLDGQANHSHRLWALMVLEIWQRDTQTIVSGS